MKSNLPGRTRRQQGFSLVELMVGIGVGLLSTVVIATILSNSERQKRASSSGNDAQIAGSLALNELDRSIKDAGYGLTTDIGTMGCTLQARFDAGTAVAGAPANLRPVLITTDKDGKPSTITLMRSTAPGFSLPAKVKAPLFDPTVASGSTKDTLVVSSTLGIAENDLLAVVTPPDDLVTKVGSCTVFQASKLAANLRDIQRVADTPWNGTGDLAPATADQYIVNLGALEVQTYTVEPQLNSKGVATSQYQLTLTRFVLRDRATTTQVIQTGVVDLKAFYGRDSDGDGVVDLYDTTTPTTAQGWSQVRSVRLAVLARSEQFEKEEVTATEPLWNVGAAVKVDGSIDCGSSKCIKMNPKAGDDSWKHYRYKLFDLISPLRNQLWRSDMIPPEPASAPASAVAP
jgi:type IV pilus assembly protein PilW